MDEMTKFSELLADREAIELRAQKSGRSVQDEIAFLLEDPIYRRSVLLEQATNGIEDGPSET